MVRDRAYSHLARRTSRALFSLVFAAVVFPSSLGAAQDGAAQDGAAQDGAAQDDAAPQSPEEEAALDLFIEAESAYEAGRVAEAIELLTRARELHPVPVLLFNLARAYETAGRLADAVDAYRRFLEEEPNASDRGAIETRILAIESQLAETQRLAEERARSEALAAEQQRAGSRPSAVPWVTVGVGVLTVGAGLTFGLLAERQRDDADAEPIHEQAVAAFARGEDFAIAANVLFVIGGVVSVTGLVWGAIDVARSGRGDEGDGPTASVAVGPGSLVVRGQF